MTLQRTTAYAVIGLLGFFAAAIAQGGTLVAPPGFEATEGNTVVNPIRPHPDPGSGDDGPDGVRMQVLYPAEYFSSAGLGPFVITRWAGRPDVSVDEPVSAEYEYTLNLATTEIDSLTGSFVGNYGASGTATTVFSGTVPEETDGVPMPGGLPHDFDYVIEFETPYVYDPSEGNLLFEQVSPTNYTTRPIWRDFHEFGSGPNLFAFSDDPAAVTAQITAKVIQIAQFTIQPLLQPGDAEQDLDFDQFDLIQVQISGKYLTGEAATWGEGDWDGAPGGSPGDPPAGDGLFNQLDIVAAQQAAVYLTGPYAAGWTDELATVPEPATSVLLVMALVAVLLCRRSRTRQFDPLTGQRRW